VKQNYHSHRKLEKLVMETLQEELEQALYWANRIKWGSELGLTDLCISSVQRHVQTLVNHIPAIKQPRTYRGLCPGCGRVIVLER
jgi:hypothetical protein